MGEPQAFIYNPRLAEVLEIEDLTEKEKLFTLRLERGEPLGHQPGQFVKVSVFGVGECPISVCSSPTRDHTFQLCVRAVGNVTNAIHRLKPGDVIGIRGPYGKGFPVDEMKGYDLLFAAGGLGMAPLRSLIQYVIDRRDEFGRVIVLYGAKQPRELLFRDELEQIQNVENAQCLVTVDRADESWEGHVGVITTLCPCVEIEPSRTMAVTVGPPIMYRFIIKEFLKMGLPEDRIYLSLERRMKCGVGKCGHCQINGVYVCKEGPVFTYAQIKDLPEAL
ncbi:MAG: oxidoreductase [Chloroflexi bacterium]|nr:MAG: oxidoreductase [Chloroflexota bacterium]HDN79279.1 oxidoreductase [Chloroflexota bacterium]